MSGRLKLFVPLVLFAVLTGFLFRGLQLDPKAMPSALIDQPFPEFSLPQLGVADRMLTASSVTGEIALFNVWATWCISCRVEHAYLTHLANQGVTIYGVNLKDEDAAALAWLEKLGDPYQLSIVDREGSLGLDLGVYGAPETYVVDAGGIIRYRHVGVVDSRVWEQILQPVVEELARGETE